MKPAIQDEKLFANVFGHAAIGMALVSPNGQWLMVNNALCDLLGYDENELLASAFQDITHPDDLESDLSFIQELLTGKKSWYQKEKRYVHKNGDVIHALLSVSLVRDDQKQPLFFISQIINITDRKELEKELVRQAKEDALTGICNRRCFFELFSREIDRGSRYGTPIVLLVLDIDHFKNINDTFGHAVGDEALKIMATTCQNVLRSFDIFSRIGGEEFAVLLINTDLPVGKQVAERLRKAVAEIEIPTESGLLRFTISIGGVAFDGREQEIEQRLKQADDALYEAKASGRNTVRITGDIAGDSSKEENLTKGFVRLEWHESYESGHAVIDMQHKILFKIANNLLAEVASPQDDNQCLTIIDELLLEIGIHFQTEETVMKRAGYPSTENHRAIHSELLNKAQSLSDKFQNKQLEVAEVIQFLVIDVVFDHLLREDKKFFPYLARQSGT